MDAEFLGLEGYFRLLLFDEEVETRGVNPKVTK